MGCQNGLDSYLQPRVKELLRGVVEAKPSAEEAYAAGYRTGQVERLIPDSDECIVTDRDL